MAEAKADDSPCVDTTQLNTGATMPLVGLGTWQSKPGEVQGAVKAALDAGYIHVDCAACYGNEKEVGEVFKAAFGEGGMDRSKVFVTGKLWNSEHAPKDVEPACRMTLADLELDYLDLYLIHWPQAFEKTEENKDINRSFPKNEDGSMKYDMDTTLMDTWTAMEDLVAKGLVKAIGLSNFNSKQIAEICEKGKIKPAVLQVENHPYFSQEPLLKFCKENGGIVMTAYSPLGSGATLDGFTVPANPTLGEIGKKYGKSAAQVAICWQKQRGVVVIPKSVTEARIRANCAVNFTLSDEDMAAIGALNKNNRIGFGGPKVDRGEAGLRPRDEAHPNYPFRDDIEF